MPIITPSFPPEDEDPKYDDPNGDRRRDQDIGFVIVLLAFVGGIIAGSLLTLMCPR